MAAHVHVPKARANRGAGTNFVRAYTSTDDDWTRQPPGTPVPMVASTPGVKRDGIALRASGWRVDNYHRSGGPVLWQHDHSRPSIGAGRATPDTLRLPVDVRFDQEDPFARSIESKLRRRFLSSASVGWDFVDEAGEHIPHHRMMGGVSSLARNAFYDLSEVSIVNVPTDPFAVAQRHWRALRSVHPGFARMYRAQERADSDVTAPQVRAAVLDLCQRLGIDVQVRDPDASGVDADAARAVLAAFGRE